jgi:hypothetical protein
MKTQYEKLNKEHLDAAQADMTKRLYNDFYEDDIKFIEEQMKSLHERNIQAYTFAQLKNKQGKSVVVQFNNQNLFMTYDEKDNLTVESKIRNSIFNTNMAGSILNHYLNMFNTSDPNFVIHALCECHKDIYEYIFNGKEWETLKELREELNNSGKEKE